MKTKAGANFLIFSGTVLFIGILLVIANSLQERPVYTNSLDAVVHATQAVQSIQPLVPVAPPKPSYEMKLIGGPPGEARAHCVADLKGLPWKPSEEGRELVHDSKDNKLESLSDRYLGGLRDVQEKGLIPRIQGHLYGYNKDDGKCGDIWWKSESELDDWLKGDERVLLPVYPCVVVKDLVDDHFPTWDGNVYYPNGSSLLAAEYVTIQKELANPASPVPAPRPIKALKRKRCETNFDCRGDHYCDWEDSRCHSRSELKTEVNNDVSDEKTPPPEPYLPPKPYPPSIEKECVVVVYRDSVTFRTCGTPGECIDTEYACKKDHDCRVQSSCFKVE